MTFFTYVLECENGSLYTGWTNDLLARFDQHRSGKGAKYTRAHKPVKMVASFQFASKAEAMRWEWHFKRMSKRAKLVVLEQAKQSVNE